MAKKFIRQMDLAKVPVDVSAFGRNLILTDAAPHVRRDTQERTGTDYEIVCVDYDFEKLKVTVDGPQTIPDEVIQKGHPQIRLSNLQSNMYNIKGSIVLSVKADRIELVNNK